MCAIAVIALCVTPPGYFFPQMRSDYAKPMKEAKEVKEMKGPIFIRDLFDSSEVTLQGLYFAEMVVLLRRFDPLYRKRFSPDILTNSWTFMGPFRFFLFGYFSKCFCISFQIFFLMVFVRLAILQTPKVNIS